jgi:hypothetical protein
VKTALLTAWGWPLVFGRDEKTWTVRGASVRGASSDISIGGIVSACVCNSGMNNRAAIVTTCAVAARTTLIGLRAVLRLPESSKAVSSMFDLLFKLSPGRSKLAGL